MQSPAIPLCSQCGYATVSLSPSPASITTAVPHTIDTLRAHLSEPNQGNMSMILQWLPGARRELADYDKEIDRLRSLLVTLESARDDLKECVDSNAALVSPVRRLPTEVLVEIFSLSCLPNTEEKAEARERSMLYPTGWAALRLSLVCSRWRKVALETPKIWSYINVSVYNHFDLRPILLLASKERGADEVKSAVEAHPLVNLVKLYLERSQDHPLAITVYCPSKVRCKHDPEVPSPTESVCSVLLSKIFNIVSEVSHRWRTAHIRLPHATKALVSDDNEGRLNLAVPVFKVPLLEVLDIYPGFIVMTFSSVLHLHTLAITATPWGNTLLNRALVRAPALRSLTLRQYAVDRLEGILSQLRGDGQEVDVCFEGFHLKELRGYQCEVYESPAMKSLLVNLERGTSTSLENIIRFLTAKRVTNMEFVCGPMRRNDDPQKWLRKRKFPQEALISMIDRSVMPLRALKIDGFAITDEALIGVLRLVPTVEVLSVGESRLALNWAEVQEINLEKDTENKDEEMQTDEQPEVIVTKSPPDNVVTPNLLRHLTVSRADATSSGSEHTLLLPELTSLSLTFRPGSQARDLVNMSRSRWRVSGQDVAFNEAHPESSSKILGSNSEDQDERRVACLQSVSVALILDNNPDARSACAEEFKGGLRELKEMGLNIQYEVLVY